MDKVAVLVTTFNGEEYIHAQLESILNQVGVELHIYASDDGSTDGTQGLLNELAINHDNLTVLPLKVIGSAASNFFRLMRDVDFSAMEYIALSDQDDIWSADKLLHAINTINIQNVDAYSSNVMAFWPDGSVKLIRKSQPLCKFDYMFESAGPGCTFLLRQKLAIKLQEWLRLHKEETRAIDLHDWFIYAFSRSQGFKWYIDPESRMLYRQHDDNVIGANVGLKAMLIRCRKFRDGWLRTQALLIADLLEYQDALPIRRIRSYRMLDRLILVMRINQLRRRLRDKIGLALFLLFSAKR